MEDLVKAACLALSANDAETLERLAREARKRQSNPLGTNLAELARAAKILSAQVHAASLHLDLMSRVQSTTTGTYKGNQWER